MPACKIKLAVPNAIEPAWMLPALRRAKLRNRIPVSVSGFTYGMERVVDITHEVN